ncbi:hypothetical protein METHP14_250013 [Pseudomonas sp. P14-2025]
MASVASAFVGAALRRERSAQRSPLSALELPLPGLLRSPFATQGRSHRACDMAHMRAWHGNFDLSLGPGPDRPRTSRQTPLPRGRLQ